MSSFEFVLSWPVLSSLQASTLLKVVLLLLGAVLLVLVMSGFWYIFFRMTAAKNRRNFGEFPSTNWNIVVVDPARLYAEYVVVPSGTKAASLSRFGRAYVLEGPFYDLDKAIARRDELAKKRP